MAIGFKQLKSPSLGLLDKIQVGKLSGCLVRDVIQDHYEYLIWAERSGVLKLKPEVVQAIQHEAHFERMETYQREEVRPWFEDVPDLNGPKTVYFEDGSGYLEACGPAGPLYFDRFGNI